MSNVESIDLAYFNRLRSQGFEAGDAFAAMRERFRTKTVPGEVLRYRNVFADAYGDWLLDDLYEPDDEDLEIALELSRQGAMIQVGARSFDLTIEGREVAERFAQERHLRRHQSDWEIDRSMPIGIAICLIGIATVLGLVWWYL